jgi:hypothetical protein
MSMIGNFLSIPQEELDALYRDPEQIGTAIYETYRDKTIDVDKAWHGIHFLLTGEQYGGEPPLANVVMGLEPIGDENIGYGPAMGTPAQDVKKIAAALDSITEEEFRFKFDPVALKEADIYPEIWDEGKVALDYLTTYFKKLQEFYKSAAAHGHAVITFIS